MFDDKLLKLTEREVIALGKSRAEEKTGFEFGPQYDFCNIVRKISGMKLFKQNLIWTQTVERKTLRPYGDQLLPAEVSQLISQISEKY